MQNPLLNNNDIPKFEEIKAEHVKPAVDAIIKESEVQLQKLEVIENPTWDNLMAPQEILEDDVHCVWGPVGHLYSVCNSEALRQAYESAQNDMVTFGLRWKQSQKIYEGVKKIRTGSEFSDLNPARKRIIEDYILSAELTGIGLKGDKRQRFNVISQELTQLQVQFSNNVLDATKAFRMEITEADELAGAPRSLLALMSQSWNLLNKKDHSTVEAGPWMITLDAPCFVPLMENCSNRDLRHRVYHEYVTRASSGKYDNSRLIKQILSLRQEKASLLGYKNYAELSLAGKMAKDPSEVYELEENLRSASYPIAEKEMEELREKARLAGEEEELKTWDVSYWNKRLMEERFQFTDEELRPYFPLYKVLDGLFELSSKLFGIKVERANGEAPVWNPDVSFYRVKDASGEPIAAFFLDPFSRTKDKRGGAWMNGCLNRHKRDGKIVLPVAYLVCNFTPPIGDKPSQLKFSEVETLFHEFGHGLQHMLTTVDELSASGLNNVEWDAVELPSQFMENWCYHKPCLMSMTEHVETGEKIPESLFERLKKAKTHFAATGMLRQIHFGLTDMKLHDGYDPEGDLSPFDVEKSVSEKTSVLTPYAEQKFLCSFSHIFAGSYAAGYFSYKWAEVLSADAYAAFEEAGLDNEDAVREVGKKFRDTILALGGSVHPAEVFEKFRGRAPSTDALLRHNELA